MNDLTTNPQDTAPDVKDLALRDITSLDTMPTVQPSEQSPFKSEKKKSFKDLENDAANQRDVMEVLDKEITAGEQALATQERTLTNKRDQRKIAEAKLRMIEQEIALAAEDEVRRLRSELERAEALVRTLKPADTGQVASEQSADIKLPPKPGEFKREEPGDEPRRIQVQQEKETVVEDVATPAQEFPTTDRESLDPIQRKIRALGAIYANDVIH